MLRCRFSRRLELRTLEWTDDVMPWLGVVGDAVGGGGVLLLLLMVMIGCSSL